jgi:hypothetical protein
MQGTTCSSSEQWRTGWGVRCSHCLAVSCVQRRTFCSVQRDIYVLPAQSLLKPPYLCVGLTTRDMREPGR